MITKFKQAFITGLSIAILLVAMRQAGMMAGISLSITDVYYTSAPVSDRITIVAIDDASLNAYGRSPVEWSRELHAQLVRRLSNARVVAFDLLFLEPSEDDQAFIEAIQSLRQGDNRTRFILAAAGFQALDEGQVLQFDRLLLPTPPLYDSIDNIGVVNTFVDADNAIRRQPSRIQLADSEFAYSFSIATYLAYLRIPTVAIPQLVTLEGNTLYLTPQTPIPIDDNGLWMQNYFGEPGTFPIVSYKDVIDGNFDPALFDDRIVLIGTLNAAGITDQYEVPTADGKLMSGVEIQAHAIETLLQGVPLQAQSRLSETAMILSLAIFCALLYAYPRWYFKLMLMVALLVVCVVVTSVIFSVYGVVTNLWYAALAITLPGLITIGLDITQEINRRRRSEFLLQSLVQVSKQQLDPHRICELLKSDIERIVPNSVVTIHQQPVNSSHTMILPIEWQGKILRYVTIDTKVNIPNRVQQLIHDLLSRIAPSLENAQLFAETQRQNELLETFLKESPQSVVILNENLVVLRSNLGFKRLLPLDLVDQALPSIFTIMGVDSKAISELLFQFENRKSFQQEIQIENKTYNLAAAPIKTYQQWVVMLVDITQLADLNKLKTRMIRMASHDLKNPLARITGYAELLLMDTTLTQENQQFIHNIQKAAHEMLQIITDILDIEQLRSGKIEKERVNMTAVTHDIVTRHMTDAEQKQQTLRSNLANGVIVMGNLRQLSQVVSNLIGNAIKYTPNGGEIDVTLRVEDDDVLLEVKDNGYGIPKDAQANLFTEFYRVRNRATAGIPGTGLGLSLVKSVVQAHRGDVWVESDENQGSTFFVRLPLEEWESPC
ncbi:MAG: CHASE2 domain-containing protein [Chloroflexi bacterium]|nr:MAG: CHASE2 domain-containing protein [Chloroflexota bacterium]